MYDATAKSRQPRNVPKGALLNAESRILIPDSCSPDLPISRSPDLLISRSRDAGIVLLAVMATVSVMLLVALAFSGSVQIETRSAIYRKEATQAYALALGGVQAAILEIAYPPAEDQKDKPRLWRRGQSLMRVPYAGGVALVEIVNESGKVDLNVADQKQLARLFEARGMEEERAMGLAKAIDRWRSPAGADDEDSKNLEACYREAGYRPVHDSFTSLEQALLVCGMSRDLFYGTAEFSPPRGIRELYGVGQDLTIYSKSAPVNVNYASKEVLLSVPGLTEELVELILEARRDKPLTSADDFAQRSGASLPDKALPFLIYDDASKIYSIVSVGMVRGSRLQRRVKAVVGLEPDGTAAHRILAWYDDVAE